MRIHKKKNITFLFCFLDTFLLLLLLLVVVIVAVVAIVAIVVVVSSISYSRQDFISSNHKIKYKFRIRHIKDILLLIEKNSL